MIAPPEAMIGRMEAGWSARSRLVKPFVCEGARVLEVGCGFGDFALALASHGAKVHIVDIDEHWFPWIQEYGATRGWSLTTERADVSTWNTTDRYDLVWCTNTLMLLGHPNRREALRRMADALAPGGTIVCDFYTPAYHLYRVLVQSLPLRLRARSLARVVLWQRGLTPKRFADLVREAGLRIEQEVRNVDYDAARAVEGHSFGTIFGRYYRCYVLRQVVGSNS